jgi:hypothetical protein
MNRLNLKVSFERLERLIGSNRSSCSNRSLSLFFTETRAISSKEARWLI